MLLDQQISRMSVDAQVRPTAEEEEDGERAQWTMTRGEGLTPSATGPPLWPKTPSRGMAARPALPEEGRDLDTVMGQQ